MSWSKEVHAADWIVSRLHPLGTDVGSLVPDAYQSYVRILHPAWLNAPDRTKVRWASLARDGSTALKPTTQFESFASPARPHVEPPRRGTLDSDELGVLIELLAMQTSRPESCWFAVWDGYAWIQGPPALAQLQSRPPRRPSSIRRHAVLVGHPRIVIPGRSFLLWKGPIESATTFCRPPSWQSPNLWWPQDRAWCVATEIDLYSTYVGGTQALADRILHDERVEALAVNVHDPIGAV